MTDSAPAPEDAQPPSDAPAADAKPAPQRKPRARANPDAEAAPATARAAEPGDADGEDDEDDVGRGSARPAPAVAAAPVEAIRFEDVVSGQFDAEEQSEDLAPPKRVLSPLPETPKLHKVLAQAGLGSRLEMEQLIMEGRISVNNEPAHVGQRIQYGDQIKVNGKPIRVRIAPPPARVIAYHKPVGEVVTHDDPQNRPTVFRKLPKLYQGKWQSVGRLDLNTEGLLLFSNSGELANKLMHPRFGLEREYAVRVLGALSEDEKQRLLDGVQLDDGKAQFGSIEEGGGEGANSWYRVTISEGRNREVRRMLEAVGHAVSRLIRIRYGAMVLPRGLKRGAWMELDDRDIRALMQAAGVAPAERGGDRGGDRGGRGGRQGRSSGRGGKPGGGGFGDSGFGGGPRGPGGPFQGPKGGKGGKPGGGQSGRRQGGGGGGGGQPDPMKTAFGYIGADSFTRQRQGGPGGGGGGTGGGNRRRGRGGR